MPLNLETLPKSLDGTAMADASDLGFRPGEWPPSVDTSGGRLYKVGLQRDAAGDITHAIYREGGRSLYVFND